MKLSQLFTILFLLIYSNSFSQFVSFSPNEDSTTKITMEGYVDAYFSYDFADPTDATMPYFVSQNRHNEFNINLAYISLKYASNRARATFTPGFGTYMNSNYASELATLRNLVEANVGVKLFSKRKIWLDVGVMSSPFTNESAISFDHPTLTRTFAAENSPYYQTAARLSLPVGKKFTTYLFLLNGWQIIEDNNRHLAFTGQLEYKPTDKLTLNLNTYYGYEESVSSPQNRTRTFLDFYAIYKPGKFNYTFSSYIGNQQRHDSMTHNETDNVWWQINGTAKYNFSDKHSIVARAEYFNDPNSVMVTPVTGVNGFKTASFSIGYNMAITPSVLLRMEARYFQSPDKVYNLGNDISNQNTLITGGLTAKF